MKDVEAVQEKALEGTLKKIKIKNIERLCLRWAKNY